MSKRTLILIVFLLVLTGFFVYLAVSQNQQKPAPVAKVTPTAKPQVAFTTIALMPQTLSLSSRSGSLNIVINTHGEKNKVTAVQLELSYDPKSLSSVTLTPGPFLPAAAPLINTVDAQQGKITYALVIPPSGQGKSGEGVVATIAFQSLLTAGASTEITVLPTTLITAEGIPESVLAKGTGATISVGTPALVSPSIQQSTTSAPVTP